MVLIVLLFVVFILNLFLTYLLINSSFLQKRLKTIRNRDIHNALTPNFGGIAIFLSFILGCILFVLILNYDLIDLNQANTIIYRNNWISIPFVLIFLIGLIDDFFNIGYLSKFFVQVTVAYIFVFFLDQKIESFYGLFDINVFSSLFLNFFSIVVVVFIINSFNLIDGVDGLASSVGIIIFILFSLIFLNNSYFVDAFFCVLIVPILSSFLYFNTSPAKIFLGDSGSLFIGFLIAFFSVRLCNLSIDSAGTINPVFILCILSYQSIDTIRVFILRIFSGKSPFLADQNHIHHFILKRTNSKLLVSFFAIIFTLFMTFLCYSLKEDINFSFFFMLLTSIILVCFFLSKYPESIFNFFKKYLM